jgi:hypothetical protein
MLLWLRALPNLTEDSVLFSVSSGEFQNTALKQTTPDLYPFLAVHRAF